MTTRISLGYIFLAMILAATISCSSGDKEQQGASPDVAEATSDQGAAPADASAAAPADASGQPADTGAPADANAAPPDANGAPADATKAPETSENEMAAADSGAPPPPADPNAPPDANAAPPADQGAAAPGDANAAAPPADANGAPPPADANAAPPADQGAPAGTDVANNAAPGGDAGQSDLFGTGAGDAPAPKPHHVGVAHIKDAPFTKGGQNLNTVYIARDGDTLPAISQKLFGEDDSKKLIKANPTLKRAVHTGDKVYFNSPNRPDDKDRMLTVYEDQGVAPSSYTTKDGDTLKALAQEWYGSEASWKEIYALNRGLASTKELPAGTELQYWPATAQVAVYGAKKNDVAQADMNNPDGAGGPPPGNNAPPPDMNNAPPPPPPGGQAANNVPPPPPAAGAVNNALPPPPANLPPPPAPPDMNNAPPPAPPMMTKKHHDMGNSIGGMDKDTIMEAVAGGVLLVGAALLIAIRRRNSRRNSGITQV